jgi:hypothetical protein
MFTYPIEVINPDFSFYNAIVLKINPKVLQNDANKIIPTYVHDKVNTRNISSFIIDSATNILAKTSTEKTA